MTSESEDILNGTAQIPVGTPEWCAWATDQIERFRATPPAQGEAVGQFITFNGANEEGNAVVFPTRPAEGVYWTLIGSGPDLDQNALAEQIVIRLNTAPPPVTGEGVREMGWITWLGGENPAPGQMVDAVWIGIVHADRSSDDLDWEHNDTSDPITAYRIAQPEDQLHD
jgi:hypothetical protein